MTEHLHNDHSLSEVHQSIDTTLNQRTGWKKVLSFLGPAYLVSVGYMDPGNWATDLQGGSKFGYSLVWVLLMSNLMALLLQGLSARLGIVRRRDLAQANREAYPKKINYILYGLAEIAIAACDLAEVLGMAIGIKLLTGLSLTWGVSITVLDTFLLLYLQKLGMRKMEIFIISLVAIILTCFLIEIILAKPDAGDIAKGFVPHLQNNEALYIAITIIGATVMPHNLYLHSALVQTRKILPTAEGIRQAIRFNRIDSTVALNIAFLVNAAILVLAATVFFKSGNSEVAKIEDAHQLLSPLLGSHLAPLLFAVALIAAGQSSTITGTLAGQIVMEGYLQLRINPWARRLLTRLLAIIPALIVIILYGEEEVDALLVFSQAILSMQLSFAVIPLIHFVSDKKKMGEFAIKPLTQVAAWTVAAVIIALNFKWLSERISEIISGDSLAAKITVLIAAPFFFTLLLYIIIYPLLKKKVQKTEANIHPQVNSLLHIEKPVFDKIAIALDFSSHDEKLIAYAIGQGNNNSRYFLVHVVESASASLHGKDSNDYETQMDLERLKQYAAELNARGYDAEPVLGFNRRSTEIVRIVKETGSHLLVLGAHRHSGIKDYLYGETVNSVRHELQIPVLIVNV